MTAHPVHGGPRYDNQWPDVLDAEAWAAIHTASDHDKAARNRARRIANFFHGARAAR